MIYESSNPQLCTLVVQTPFQFFIAIHIAELSSVPCDLFVIDRGLLSYVDKSRNLKLFNNISYIERNVGNIWTTKLLDRLIRLKKVWFSQKKIKQYLKEENPRTICIFSDNNELTAAFSTFGKKYTNANIVLIEEGTTVYFSPFRVQTSWLKGLFRSLLGIQNPNGYLIGWSPNIDTLLVSFPEKIHPEFSQNRKVLKWPIGPFPESVFQRFSTFINMKTLPLEEYVRLIYLGQPFQELGILSKEDEERFLEILDSHSIANKIWVKPHPFDSEDKYDLCKNLKLFNGELKNTPAEVLFYFLKPEIVISYFSSAGLNYCIREGKPAIFYLPDVGVSRQFSLLLREKFNDFSTIYLVNEIEEIPKVINTILNKRVKAINDHQPIAKWQEVINSLL